jgi:hypothetical protein
VTAQAAGGKGIDQEIKTEREYLGQYEVDPQEGGIGAVVVGVV